MPTEEFLARLVRSKAAGASTAMPSIGVESGPEVVSKSHAPHSKMGGVGAYGTTLVKEKEKKRHRDGHSSKSQSSKKLKVQLTCPSSDKVDLFSDDVVGADIEVSEIIVGGGLRVCKDFADKLSMELERLLKLEDVAGPFDVKKLRDEVKGLKKLNEELEENSKNLAHDNTVAADRLFIAQTEKSELITECDSLSGQVKDLGIKVQNLEEALKTANGTLVKGEEAWAAERAELMERMNGLNDQLTKCQTEAMSSFEEGYGESVAHFARLGIDVKDRSFDSYLVDLAKKSEIGKTGSSEAIQAT